jgi:hypothetical protein
LVALTHVESSNIPKGINDFPSRKCEREGITEMPDLWTTFSHSLTQKKSESFFPEATKQQVEEFIFIESDKEEDGETWATVSLSSSTQTSSKASRQGNFLFELKTWRKFFAYLFKFRISEK